MTTETLIEQRRAALRRYALFCDMAGDARRRADEAYRRYAAAEAWWTTCRDRAHDARLAYELIDEEATAALTGDRR